MRKCGFSTKYYDYGKQNEVSYKCPEQDQSLILDSGFCLFHDMHFLDNEKNREVTQKQFLKKIEDYLSNVNDKPLFCIGYRLFDINLSKEFPKPVYFDEMSVSGPLTINCKFISYVSLINSQFSGIGDIKIISEFTNEGGVDFRGAKFTNEGDVDFRRAKFTNEGGVDFSHAEFSNKGTVDFSAEFSNKGGVNLLGTKFSNEGDVIFIATDFFNEWDVIFIEAEFTNEGGVDFSGAEFPNGGFIAN
jgi:uncharacterized protein YjbI with pentapeptide repeats